MACSQHWTMISSGSQVSKFNRHFQAASYLTSLGLLSPLFLTFFDWTQSFSAFSLPLCGLLAFAVSSFSVLTLNIRIFQCLRSFSFFYWYSVPRLSHYASSFHYHLYADDSQMYNWSPLQIHISPWHLRCVWANSCRTLCDPFDYSPLDSSVHGILQTRILEWAAISSLGLMSKKAPRAQYAQTEFVISPSPQTWFFSSIICCGDPPPSHLHKVQTCIAADIFLSLLWCFPQ